MKNIRQEIQKLRDQGMDAHADILEQHYFGKWHPAVSFEELMDEDEKDYQNWLKQQKVVDNGKNT